MKTEKVMRAEIVEAGRLVNLPVLAWGTYCQSGKDGDCNWAHCPQNRDNEPTKTGRHCPLDLHVEERGYQ